MTGNFIPDISTFLDRILDITNEDSSKPALSSQTKTEVQATLDNNDPSDKNDCLPNNEVQAE